MRHKNEAVQETHFMTIDIPDEGKCETYIQRGMGMPKHVLQNASKYYGIGIFR